MLLMHRCCPFKQVRVTQLDKEAGELREENTSLHEEVEALRTSAADGAKVCACLENDCCT